LLRQSIIRYLKKLHHALPFAFRQLYMPLINFCRKFRLLLPKLYYIEGEEKSSGSKMRLTYLGCDERILYYWLGLIYTQHTLIRKKIRLPIWKTVRFLNENINISDLALVELNNITKRIIPSDSGFIIPKWLDMKIDIDRSLKTKQIQHIKRQIRKYRLSCENGNTLSDLAYFYHRMYIPYTTERYENGSLTADFEYFVNVFKKEGSRLFFIIKDGERVAGSIDIKKGNTIFMHSLGILDARLDLLKMGVLGSSYYFKMLDYKTKGYNSLEIGGTCPILTNGLTQHKLTLGAESVDQNTRKQYIMFRPLRDTVAVRKYLESNPFVYLNENCYYSALFIGDGGDSEKADFFHLYNQLKYRNIKRLLIHSFIEVNSISSWLNEPENSVEFINYKIGDK
jgi:hypothetical protein